MQKVYWNLPQFAKSWMATLYALRLDRNRYGPEFQACVRDIESRNHWDLAQFEADQRIRLNAICRSAVRNVPFYRDRFRDAGIDPIRVYTLDDLSGLPILEKSTVREDILLLLNHQMDPRKLMAFPTSGTTGTPLMIHRDPKLGAIASAYLDIRWREVGGMLRRSNSSVAFGGHLVTSPQRRHPPFWVYNARWRQLYMSSYHLSPQYLDSYVDAIRKFGPDFIEGYPSSLYAVAAHIVQQNLPPVPVKACFTTAEKLFEHQREAIAQAFCSRTYDQYGCGEMVVFAAECPHGTMHLSPEIGMVEVLDEDDRPLPAGQTGQLVCTSLVNHIQPFIRYRLGDRGALGDQPCPCGSQLPVLLSIDGRADDVLITNDGRRIGRLDPVFKGTTGIREAQIIQDQIDRFRILIVPSTSYREVDGERAQENLAARVGSGEIKIELVDHIERTPAGKFRAVICRMPEVREGNVKD